MYAFGYGSLVAAGGVTCELRGYRRRWNVAMDNSRCLPGYKYYVDPASGRRPAVMVAFLNIEADPAGVVNGVVLHVEDLAGLDDRERNYRRRDVRNSLSPSFDRPVWAYFGTPAARRRYQRGAAAGRAVVSRAYHDAVLAGFAVLGPQALDAFRRTTDPPEVPLRTLERREIPPA